MDALLTLQRANRGSSRCRCRLAPAIVAIFVLVALGLHGSPVAASEWRVVFGSSLVEWDADDGAVPAGECPDGSCHGFDLETANLTDGLGAHFALEYLFNREATIRWFAGSQLDLTAAEYRSSQRSLGIGELHLVGGVEANLGALRPVVRAGAGYAVAEPGSSAAAMFVEPSLHIALSAEAGIRLGYRWSSHGDADSEDLVVSLVAPLDKPGMSGQWDLSWAAGALLTGPFGSEDLGLRSGPYWQLGVHKHVDLVRGRLGLIVQGAARESPLSLRFPREIDLDETVRIGGLSIQWDREMDPYLGLPWQLGGGITVADWDKDFFTLLNQHQELLKPAVEVGAYLMAQIRLLDYRGARLIAGVEPVYWPELDLYEVRARLGFEISP